VNYPDVDLKLIDTSVDFTKGNYEAAISTLFEGAVLAVIIVLLFLRDLRATIIAAVSLPLSIFPAFWAMDILGFSLNLVSFLAITLSTGILVDDAIVEIENIVRHMRMGKSPYRAALEAADEIGLAVIAISLTAWPPYARLARAETLTRRNAEFIEAAELQGASHLRILFTQIMPLSLPSVIIRLTLDMAGIILTAAGLGFQTLETLLSGIAWLAIPAGNPFSPAFCGYSPSAVTFCKGTNSRL
jgi:ABC-type dipeptide/oligopeptide/nickel transport system permease subunit